MKKEINYDVVVLHSLQKSTDYISDIEALPLKDNQKFFDCIVTFKNRAKIKVSLELLKEADELPNTIGSLMIQKMLKCE